MGLSESIVTQQKLQRVWQGNCVKECHDMDVRKLGVYIGHGHRDSDNGALNSIEVGEKNEKGNRYFLSLLFLVLELRTHCLAIDFFCQLLV